MAAPLIPVLIWQVPIDALAARVQTYIVELDDNVNRALTDVAIDIQGYGQQYHVWQNRTFAAEQSLAADVVTNGHIHTLTFSHGVYYGIYLETMQGGRFAIIMPTLQAYYAVIMNRLLEVVS